MRSTRHALVLVLGLGLAACSQSADDAASADEEVKTSYASPGKELGRTTHLVADPAGDAVFSVYDRALERRTADGKVQAIAKVDSGFEALVVSNEIAAVMTSAFVNGGGSKATLRVYSRAEGWKEVRTEDLSTPKGVYKHPVALLDDETIAVGSTEDLIVFTPDGKRTTLGGYNSKFRADELRALYPTGDAGHVFAALDNGEIYDVDTKANTLTLQPKREGEERAFHVFFHAKSKRWVTVDFRTVTTWGLDGKRVKQAELVTEKSRFFTDAALHGDSIVLVNDSEKSQERSVLAVYDLETLTRKEVGTFDGVIGELAPVRDQLFFGFSPKGAEGFASRVFYAHVRKM